MKKYILYMVIFVFLVLNVNCASDPFSGTAPDNGFIGETITIKVKEYRTDMPLSGVRFSTYYCNEYDFEFGSCIDKILLSSCITDTNGVCNCSFPRRSFEDIIIEKDMYWIRHYHAIESSHEYVIQPKAWVDVNFTTGSEYPATSTFFITVNGELRFERSFIQAANDSNLVLTLFGNEENIVDWQLYETFNSISPLLNSGSFVLNPQRFETLSYNLSY